MTVCSHGQSTVPAVYRDKQPKPQIDKQADELLAWLNASFRFQVTEITGVHFARCARP